MDAETNDRIEISTNLRRMRRRPLPLPPEGEGGFSQSWYPVCLSAEVGAGAVLGADFLDGRIVIMRGEDGGAQVLSAYCPHMGADLTCGGVEGGELRCAFHGWSFDRNGACTRTMVGDPVPPHAKLFPFPTAERFGLIWAFNGTEPLYELPGFDRPDADLLVSTQRQWLLPCDPGCLVCNSLDMQHVVAVHGFDLDRPSLFDAIEWSPFRVKSTVSAHIRESRLPIEWETVIFGTNAVRTSGLLGERWYGTLTVFGLPSPGYAQTYCVTVVEKGDGTPAGDEAAQQFLEMGAEFQKTQVESDSRIMTSIRFVQGTLTKSDQGVAALLKHFRNYPRAHDAADFIA